MVQPVIFKKYTMANANSFLINALRETADRLSKGADYAWGNHGSCNCGNLLQVITALNRTEILRLAHTGIGEWTELAEEYCGVSLVPVDQLIGHLMEAGLTPTDVHNIEYLEDRDVLERLPGGFRWLKRNERADVIIYLQTMASLLEEKLQAELCKENPRPRAFYKKVVADPALKEAVFYA
jgi:hypothetical protein